MLLIDGDDKRCCENHGYVSCPPSYRGGGLLNDFDSVLDGIDGHVP